MSLYPYTETHDFTRLRKKKKRKEERKEEEDGGQHGCVVIYVEETKLTSVVQTQCRRVIGH